MAWCSLIRTFTNLPSVVPEDSRIFKSKARTSNIHYTRGIASKSVNTKSGGGTHVRGLAPGQHSSEKPSQWWRAIGDTASDFTGPGIEPQILRFDGDVLDN